MARLFASASSQYVEASTAARTAKALSLACWYKPTTHTTQAVLVALHLASTANRYFGIGVQTTGAPFVAERGNASVSQNHGSTITDGVWAHIAGTFNSGTSGTRTPYLNGVAGTGNAGAVSTPPVPDRTVIGALPITTAGVYTSFTDGVVAEVGIWNVSLTADDVAMLAHGARPFEVRPSALVFYAPLLSGASPEQDIRGQLSLALTGTPTQAPHPPTLGQTGKFWIPPLTVTAVAVTGTIAATSSLTGAVTDTAPLTGTVASTSSLTGDLTVAANTAGTIAATSALTGTITPESPLTGSINATSALTGALTDQDALTGTIAATSTLAGTLTNNPAGQNPLVGTITSTSTLAGTLRVTKPLAGTITTQSTITATLGAAINLTAALASTSTLTGTVTLTPITALTGSIDFQASLTGTLTSTAPAPPEPVIPALRRYAIHWFWEPGNHSEQPDPPKTCPECGAPVVLMTLDLEVFCRHYATGATDTNGTLILEDCPYIATINASNYAQPLAADIEAGYVLTAPVA